VTRELDVEELRRGLIAKGVRLVAIDGCGGSGKSVLATQLVDGWPDAVVIEVDDFYRPTSERQVRPATHGANVDLGRLVAQVLGPASRGRGGRYQRYDWDADGLSEWHNVDIGSVLIVEGVYSSSEALRHFYDFVIWVDCPYEVRLARGVQRDGEAMRGVWVEQWMPAEARYVDDERPQDHADLVVDGGVDELWAVERGRSGA